jgi:hypothetical protein
MAAFAGNIGLIRMIWDFDIDLVHAVATGAGNPHRRAVVAVITTGVRFMLHIHHFRRVNLMAKDTVIIDPQGLRNRDRNPLRTGTRLSGSRGGDRRDRRGSRLEACGPALGRSA